MNAPQTGWTKSVDIRGDGLERNQFWMEGVIEIPVVEILADVVPDAKALRDVITAELKRQYEAQP